ncbi:MAG: ParB/RepB/Spo0J family partition protein [Proteobacteria bacterium]|nr:ParB/RepB/Spo0J family partition protein [Pseudomonadota bacterium]MDA1299968.1 ParB/RepB/Spo0J family partition protein [Pseudomonadota bacterium]
MVAKGKKRGLGRGLDALLGGNADDQPNPEPSALQDLPIEWLRPGKYQPRKDFPEEALEELAQSIRHQGVMQPIVVRPVAENRFEIIAGERRWRAAQRASLETIPAVIRDVDDEAALAMSLIENVQREDLNAMEEAQALQRLVSEFNLTHQQVADAVGKSRTAITNYLRLNNLAPRVMALVGSGDIDFGHARALLSLADSEQEAAANQIVDRQLNVRQAEELVRHWGSKPPPPKPVSVDSDTRKLQDRLSASFGQPVRIQHSKGKGKVVISYSSLDELDGILARFGKLE